MKLPVIKPDFFPLETDNLYLNFINKTHTAYMLSMFSDYELLKYTDNNIISNKHEAKNLIKKYHAEYLNGSGIYLGIFLPHTKNLIGVISIHNINYKHQFAEVSFLLQKKYWNMGFMTEVSKKLFQTIFKHTIIYRLEAQIFVENHNSQSMIEKIGMKKEGRLRKNFLIGGVLKDSYIYSILKTDFKS